MPDLSSSCSCATLRCYHETLYDNDMEFKGEFFGENHSTKILYVSPKESLCLVICNATVYKQSMFLYWAAKKLSHQRSYQKIQLFLCFQSGREYTMYNILHFRGSLFYGKGHLLLRFFPAKTWSYWNSRESSPIRVASPLRWREVSR